MMHRTISFLIFVGLASGGLGACASNLDVSIVGPLDANGNIKVHEQGTANVNVTNASLPVAGTVNVGNLPSTQNVNVTNSSVPVSGTVNVGNLTGSVVKVADHVTLPNIAGQGFPFPPLDTSNCHSLAAFTRGATLSDNVNALTISLDVSADSEANFVGRLSPITVAAPGHPGRSDYFPVPGGQGLPATAPQSTVIVQNSTGSSVTFSIWILCSR